MEFEQTHKQISSWLGDLDHQLHLLYIHQTDGVLEGDEAIKNEILDVLVAVAVFATRLIRFYRRDALGWFQKSHVLRLTNNIEKARLMYVFDTRVKQEFESMMKQIRKKNQELRERIEALKLQQTTREGSQSIPTTLGAHLPCLVTPWRRNDQFYGRGDILGQIDRVLNPIIRNSSGKQQISSLAIYGTAGIGKTQIALAYAFRCAENGVPAVLWVNSEDSLSIEQSFNKIALGLRLAGASTRPEQSSENRALAMKWLETTGTSRCTLNALVLHVCIIDFTLIDAAWLMVFDNVENPNLVSKNWPSGTSGSILVTCRTVDVAIQCAPKPLPVEIPTLNQDEGMELLISLVERPDAHSEKERQCARELSQALDGLPLALVLMGIQVRSRRMTFEDFLPFHGKHHKKLAGGTAHNEYYNNDLQTAWEIPFKGLGEDSALLFGLLSFLGPDVIPEHMFLSDQKDLPPSPYSKMKFLSEDWG